MVAFGDWVWGCEFCVIDRSIEGMQLANFLFTVLLHCLGNLVTPLSERPTRRVRARLAEDTERSCCCQTRLEASCRCCWERTYQEDDIDLCSGGYRVTYLRGAFWIPLYMCTSVLRLLVRLLSFHCGWRRCAIDYVDFVEVFSCVVDYLVLIDWLRSTHAYGHCCFVRGNGFCKCTDINPFGQVIDV
jgi:hypothetical protein